jgi:hypothetical protein
MDIITESQETPLAPNRSILIETALTLLDSGKLIRLVRFGEISRDPDVPSWSLEDETELSCEAAITIYGLDAIAQGLCQALRDVESMKIMRDGYENRLENITKALHDLRGWSSPGGDEAGQKT